MMGIPIDCLTALNRPIRSATDPSHDANTTAASDRTSAYTDAYNSVPLNIELRNSTAPNSNMREFHVDRPCEM